MVLKKLRLKLQLSAVRKKIHLLAAKRKIAQLVQRKKIAATNLAKDKMQIALKNVLSTNTNN